MKTCPSCKTVTKDFGKNKRAKDGLTSYCRLCHNKQVRESKLKVHGDTRHYHYVLRYGIGTKDKEQLLEAQGNVCAICCRKADRWHIDHDHGSGIVRGILCMNCNQGLGNFKDNAQTLKAAIEYLGGE